MEFTFEKLNVWQGAAEFATNLLQETEKYSTQAPTEIMTNLKRASLEVPSYLARGKSYYQGQDFLPWLNKAKESIFEVASLVKMSESLNLMEKTSSNSILESANKIIAQMIALSKSIESRSQSQSQAT